MDSWLFFFLPCNTKHIRSFNIFNHCGIMIDMIVSTQVGQSTSSPMSCADDEMDGVGGLRRQLFQSPIAGMHHVPDEMVVDMACARPVQSYFVRSHPYNQNAEFLGKASPVACVFNGMCFMRRFFLGIPPSWTSDHTAVLAVLVEGSQYKALYDELVVPQQRQIFGPDNVDSHVMPDEVMHALLNGVLSGQDVPGFSQLRDFLSHVQLTQLAVASPTNTLGVALARACDDIQSKRPHAVAHMLICEGKASTILSCGHSGCYALYWDSHIWNVEKMEDSASVLFNPTNSQSLLEHMSGRYSADSPCYLFAFMHKDQKGFHNVQGQSCHLGTTHGFQCVHGQSMVSPAMVCPSMMEESDKSDKSDNDDGDDDGICNGRHADMAAVTAPPKVMDVPQVAVSPMDSKVCMDAPAATTMSPKPANTDRSDRHLEMVMTTPPQRLDNQMQSNQVEIVTAAVGTGTPSARRGWAKLRGCHGSCCQSHQSPKMQTPMKTSPPNKRVVDVVASQQPCSKRHRKSKEETAIARTGKSMALQLGIDFHKVFQPVHGFHLEAKHWMKFQTQLAKGLVSPSDLNCAACTAVMDEVAVAYQALVEEGVEGTPNQPVTVAHAGFTKRMEELKQQEEMVDITLGRRAPSHSGHSAPLWQDLYQWLNVRRPGMYVVLGTGKVDLHCTVCMSKFSAHRTNTIFWVLQHEANSRHYRMLTCAKKTCKGVALNGQSCESISWQFRESFREWIQNGCPWHFAMKHQCHTDAGGVPVVMAANCEQDNFRPVDGSVACHACRALCHNGEFSQRVATWHYRIHLANLVLATALGQRAEEKQLLQQMARAPYIGHAQISIDVHALQGADFAARKNLLRRQVLCLAKSMRNDAANQFIQCRLAALPSGQSSQHMLDAIANKANTLVSGRSDKHDKNDLDLCRLILEGALHADVVCRTMVSALIHKGDKLLGINFSQICQIFFNIFHIFHVFHFLGLSFLFMPVG